MPHAELAPVDLPRMEISPDIPPQSRAGYPAYPRE
jgi:hypothetical protein